MRVYELAKEAGVTSAQVLEAARKRGIEATSAISAINKYELGALREEVAGLDKGDLAAKRSAKAAKASALRKAAAEE